MNRLWGCLSITMLALICSPVEGEPPIDLDCPRIAPTAAEADSGLVVKIGSGALAAPYGTAYAVAPNGQTMAVGYDSGEIHLWSLKDGSKISASKANYGRPETMAYLNEDKFVVFWRAGNVGDLCVHDAKTCKLIKKIYSCNVDDVRKIIVSDKCHRAVLVGRGMRLIDLSNDKCVVESGKISPTQRQGNLTRQSVHFTDGDSKFLYVDYDANIRLYDSETGKVLLECRALKGEKIFAPIGDGKLVLATNGDHEFAIINLKTNERLSCELKSPKVGGYEWINVSPTGKRIVTGDGYKVSFFDYASGKINHVCDFSNLGQIGEFMFAGSENRGLLKLVKSSPILVDASAPDKIFPSKPLPDFVQMTSSPDGKLVLSAREDLWYIDPRTWRSRHKWAGVFSWYPFVMTEDHAVVVPSHEGVNIIQLDQWKFREGPRYKTTGQGPKVCVSPDGKRLVYTSQDRSLIVIDIETGDELAKFVGSAEGATDLKFVNGNRQVAAVYKADVQIFDVASRQSVAIAPTDRNDPNPTLKVDIKGKFLVTQGRSTSILYQVAENGKLNEIDSNSNHNFSIASMSPNGAIAVVGDGIRYSPVAGSVHWKKNCH